MAGEAVPSAVPESMTDQQARRWAEVLDHLSHAIPSGAVTVVVDGFDAYAELVADRLAAALHGFGRPCVRLTDTAPLATEDSWRAEQGPELVALADGPRWRERPPTGKWDVVIWLRRPPAGRSARGDHDNGCDIVVDLHDPLWPVIRHLDSRLVAHDLWYLSESRAFFAIRARTWDTKFGDDLPAYAAAVAEADLPRGGSVVDVGCGTGRALPALREAVGSYGSVIGLDLTPEMLAVARTHARERLATLVLGDARQLPIRDGAVDAVFAAGLVMHLPEPDAGLRELARITRPGGLLVLFHPSGRAALAARHGRPVRPDEPLSEEPLRTSAGLTGWHLTRYDDAVDRFLAIAVRVGR
ncbi:class I SAM-dependent methyltransferase [Micromonospora sp. NPDC050417]|uniref:class I SAM-dependent methyltransferase n=1 Tax=Micromonospora sp. NPDC050417 TaxID=3364280 RepID=UPI00378BAA23